MKQAARTKSIGLLRVVNSFERKFVVLPDKMYLESADQKAEWLIKERASAL